MSDQLKTVRERMDALVEDGDISSWGLMITTHAGVTLYGSAATDEVLEMIYTLHAELFEKEEEVAHVLH